VSTTDPSTDTLRLITERRSAPALTTPGPTDEQLRAILAAAASVPDHGRLRPYRFVIVAGEARRRFGAALRAAALAADADPVTVAKASRKPMFGPLQVVIIASPRAHATVPVWEQEVTASLTGYAMQLAAAALGVGAAWKSGHHLDEEPIRRLFDLEPGERLLGWVNLGTTTASDKPAKQVDTTRPDPVVSELTADPLMRVDELAARLDDPSLRVCDVRWFLGDPARGRREYLAGHIPGAIAIDLETDLSDHAAPDSFGRHPLPDPRTFSARMGALGIGADDVVVAYDDGPGTVAARLWWMLDALGHRGVRVLDGGLAAWRAAGLPIETGAAPVLPPATLQLAADWPRVIGRDELRERLGSLALLDVRAGERYRGEIEPVDPVPGHIPTARNAPAGANTSPAGRLLPPDDLRARFASLTDDLPVVVSCGSGVTACQAALAMRVAGLEDPVLYAGSYSDWVNAGLPVATGPEPGPPSVAGTTSPVR
jgi:thiosulfate/3-mercaptopyruvate sulfurtransferase